MDKRAQYDLSRKVIYFIVVLFFLAIMFLLLNSTFKTLDLRVLAATEKMSHRVLINEMVFSPHCFAYIDPETNRAYPGVIDLARFNDANLYNPCGKYYKGKFTAYLVLDRSSLPNAIYSYRFASSAQDNADKLLKVGNANGKYDNYLKMPVLVKNDDKIERGVLIVGYAQ